MRLWRICAAAHRSFDGEGAREFGGRWNRPGIRVVYTSGRLSLAAIESFVHLDPDVAPEDLVAIPAELPANVAIAQIEVATLPRNWRDYPAPEALQDLGTAWVRDASTAVLSVPTAILSVPPELIPDERNYLLNPTHDDFDRIQIGGPHAFRFDPRLWKRTGPA